MTLVDSNVLLDIVTADARWSPWSVHQMNIARLQGAIVINDIIYAEISPRFMLIEDLDTFLRNIRVARRVIPDAALFLAARIFLQYRRRGGTRTGVLPDFFIGAQASVERLTLLTRDERHYRSYFPMARIISP